MSIRSLSAIGLLCVLTFPIVAYAGDIAASAKVSTLGLGLEVTESISDSFTGRVGLNGFDYKYSGTESDVDYDVKLKLQSVSLLADWYPWQGAFRTSVGLMYNNNKFSLNAKPSGGTYTINGVVYPAADVGSMHGDVTFNKIAPYIGIGWGNPVEKAKHWGFVSDIGVLYQNSPKSNLEVTCGAAVPALTCASLKSDAEAERAQLESSMKSYKWYPVISIGVSYKY
jgi:hypothetical protein